MITLVNDRVGYIPLEAQWDRFNPAYVRGCAEKVIVDNLVERGFVLRKQDQLDRRRVVISLSAAGRRTTRHLEAIISKMEHEFLTALNAAERQRLYELLEKLKTRADQIFA